MRRYVRGSGTSLSGGAQPFRRQHGEGAGHDVPLAQFGTPADPDYWRAVEDLGWDQVALLLPTKPREESLRILDEFAEQVAKYRG